MLEMMERFFFFQEASNMNENKITLTLYNLVVSCQDGKILAPHLQSDTEKNLNQKFFLVKGFLERIKGFNFFFMFLRILQILIKKLS